jgi:hypothetical protein
LFEQDFEGRFDAFFDQRIGAVALQPGSSFGFGKPAVGMDSEPV